MAEFDPEKLRAAAQALSLLPDEIDGVAVLGAEQVEGKLPGSAIGKHLAVTTQAATQARDALKARFAQLSQLLIDSANTFHDSDTELAGRLAAITDLLPTGGDGEN